MNRVQRQISSFFKLPDNRIFVMLGLLMLSSCGPNQSLDKKLESTQADIFKPLVFSLTRLDSVESYLDSLKALPRVDNSLIKGFVTNAASRFIPTEVTDTVTTYHRYASLNLAGQRAEVIAQVTDFNTIAASLHLMLFDKAGKCISVVPLAFHYDEAGGKEEWSSVQKSPTTFLQRKEMSDFVYSSMVDVEGESRDPIGRGSTIIKSNIEVRGGRLHINQVDSTYTVTKY